MKGYYFNVLKKDLAKLMTKSDEEYYLDNGEAEACYIKFKIITEYNEFCVVELFFEHDYPYLADQLIKEFEYKMEEHEK